MKCEDSNSNLGECDYLYCNVGLNQKTLPVAQKILEAY